MFPLCIVRIHIDVHIVPKASALNMTLKPTFHLIMQSQNWCVRSVQKLSLSRHKKVVHTVDFKYKCTCCGKRYFEKAMYFGHLNMHVGSKPYYCQTCTKSFSYEASLRKHAVTCKGEFPEKIPSHKMSNRQYSVAESWRRRNNKVIEINHIFDRKLHWKIFTINSASRQTLHLTKYGTAK